MHMALGLPVTATCFEAFGSCTSASALLSQMFQPDTILQCILAPDCSFDVHPQTFGSLVLQGELGWFGHMIQRQGLQQPTATVDLRGTVLKHIF